MLSSKPVMKNFSKRGNAADRNASYSTLHHDRRPSIGLLGSRYKSERYRLPFKEGVSTEQRLFDHHRQGRPRPRTHDTSFDRILGIIIPGRGGVTGYYEPVHQSLIFLGENIVKRREIVMPLFLCPGADNRRRDDPVI
jgi:hypothetical protein